MLDYTPEKCNWQRAIKLAEKMRKQIGAKKIINLRVARGGCFIARYLLEIKNIKGIEADFMCEIKIYDNIPYMEKK